MRWVKGIMVGNRKFADEEKIEIWRDQDLSVQGSTHVGVCFTVSRSFFF